MTLHFSYFSQDSPSQSYFAVFDGHGGMEAADYAATHLHLHLVKDYQFNNDPAAAMKRAYKTTDLKFIEKAKREVISGCIFFVKLMLNDNRITYLCIKLIFPVAYIYIR